MSSHRPEGAGSAEEPMVRGVETSVILAGGTHGDPWVHPSLVTIPGETIAIEVALRSTERTGRDEHVGSHYFRTDDDFASLHPVDGAESGAWKRIGVTVDSFEPPTIDGTDLRDGKWHWAREYVHVDPQTVLCPFLAVEGENHSVRTVGAKRDGDAFVPLYVSNALANGAGRGLLEPQIASHDGRHYMTMRAEDGRGYASTSDDAGRSWAEPQAWRWDDGDVVPMHATMTKLLSHSDGLLLIYTRVRSDNHAVFRNRAPLHCADVDPATLSLRRSTERIILTNRGFPLGSFWVWPVDQQKSYVVASEWPLDGRAQNGDTWLAKIHWSRPNELMTDDGHERAAVGE